MAVYTVHEPPQRDSGSSAEPERFVFVRDGFHFWALVFGPLWLLWHALWLVLLLYVGGWIIAQGALWYFRAGAGLMVATNMAFGLLLALEASSLWRWTLALHGWKEHGVVVGDDLESAERRFFQTWNEKTKNGHERPRAPATSPVLTNYGPKTSDNGSDVIGLFPEPGGPR